MPKENNFVGEIFRNKTHGDLFIVLYHGVNCIIYAGFIVTESGIITISGNDDLYCATDEWFNTKEPTGLSYVE